MKEIKKKIKFDPKGKNFVPGIKSVSFNNPPVRAYRIKLFNWPFFIASPNKIISVSDPKDALSSAPTI